MNDHIDKKDAMLYVYGILPASKRQEIDLHLKTCNVCMLYVTHLEHKKFESCKKIRLLFDKAYKDRLKKEDARFWDTHIKYCDTCFEEYTAFIEKKQKGMVRIFLGYISHIAEKIKGYGQPQILATPVLQAKTKRVLESDIIDIKTFSKKGIEAALIVDKKGNMKAYFDSKIYNLSDTAVEIAVRTKKGYITIARAKVNKKGVASLGNIYDLKKKSDGKKCALILTELNKNR
ncbi:MAG: hypothetical protein N2596_04355 [Syntrophorhabdaceae bacterium]|nr:hypothetical protein [Syntrophorhabdaceae bacterium]